MGGFGYPFRSSSSRCARSEGKYTMGCAIPIVRGAFPAKAGCQQLSNALRGADIARPTMIAIKQAASMAAPTMYLFACKRVREGSGGGAISASLTGAAARHWKLGM